MAKRLQYQRLAIVPPASSSGTNNWLEWIFLDKWQPRYPDILYRVGNYAGKVGLTAAILAGSFVGPPPALGSNNWNEAVRVDKFKPTLVDYHYQPPKLSRAIQSGSYFATIPAENNVAKYKPTYPDRVDARKPLPTAAQMAQGVIVPYADGIDCWFSQVGNFYPIYPDAIRRIKTVSQAVQAGSSFFTWPPPAAAETILVDKWIGYKPDILFRNKYLPASVQAGSSFFVPTVAVIPEGPITMDKWYQLPSQPTMRGKYYSMPPMVFVYPVVGAPIPPLSYMATGMSGDGVPQRFTKFSDAFAARKSAFSDRKGASRARKGQWNRRKGK